MKTFYKLQAFFLAVIIATAGFIPAVAYSKYIDGIIEYNLQSSSSSSVQEWIDGELTENAGLGSEWYVIALSNHGKYNFSEYKKSLIGYLSENEIGSASSRLKYALTFVAIGEKDEPYIRNALENSIGKQGIMSLVFGLHLLNNGCVSEKYSQSNLISEILSFQLADGGWAIHGENGDVDTSAMTIQALSPHYYQDSTVKTAVDNAIDFLSVRQNENGGYSSYGVCNPESISQVIIALSSLGIDAVSDSRFIKNGNTVFDGINLFRLPDGSYCHKEGGESNSTATVQVMSGAIAYEKMKNGKSPFYIFAKTETEAETTTDIITTQSSAYTKKSEKTTWSTVTSVTSDVATQVAESQTDKNDSIPLIAALFVIMVLICIALLLKSRKNVKVMIAAILIGAIVVCCFIGYVLPEGNADYVGTVTISIRCDTIKDFPQKHIPADGFILDETKVEIKNGDTVYDVLSEVCQKSKIHFSANMTYIEGINNIYEMDFGKSSGWIYFVNGESPSVGCGSYELSDGDNIQWHYTCEMGKDLDISYLK